MAFQILKISFTHVSSSFTENLNRDLIDNPKKFNQWKKVILKNDDSPDNLYFKFCGPGVKNVGYINLKLDHDSAKAYFMHPKYGPPADDKIKAFIFSQFIEFLIKNYNQYIKDFSFFMSNNYSFIYDC